MIFFPSWFDKLSPSIAAQARARLARLKAQGLNRADRTRRVKAWANAETERLVALRHQDPWFQTGSD